MFIHLPPHPTPPPSDIKHRTNIELPNAFINLLRQELYSVSFCFCLCIADKSIGSTHWYLLHWHISYEPRYEKICCCRIPATKASIREGERERERERKRERDREREREEERHREKDRQRETERKQTGRERQTERETERERERSKQLPILVRTKTWPYVCSSNSVNKIKWTVCKMTINENNSLTPEFATYNSNWSADATYNYSNVEVFLFGTD